MPDSDGEQELLFFNGINGDLGSYDIPPMSGEELAKFIKGESPPENLNELRFRHEQETKKTFGVAEGVDPKKLSSAGWGIIFPADTDPAVKEALGDLLKHRQGQAGEFFKVYEGTDGFRPEEDKSKFLARHGAGPGPADPKKVPYYLLIAGSPAEIPYRFQSQLDVQYATGRIHFETVEEYAHYARSVVEAESKPLSVPRQVTFFGVANADDRATGLSAEQLIKPMAGSLKSEVPGWNFETIAGDEATKAHLARLLGGDETPALLFSASHGMSFPMDSKRQLPHQGALLCQDWPGPQKWTGEIPQEFYFAGDDLESQTDLKGLIAFFFACYGAGTPAFDEFAKQAFKDRSAIAPHAFLAQLPAKMLSRPKGGALAIIGHVERAWGYSFLWPKAGSQTEVFESTLKRLMSGYPVGAAVEYLNERYAELSTVLSDQLEEVEFGKLVDPYELAGLWTANNDARGYAVIGDPAVRLPVAQTGQEVEEEPAITVTTAASVETAGSGAGAVAFEAETKAEASVWSVIQPAAEAELKRITVVTFVAADMDAVDEGKPAAISELELDGDLETILAEEILNQETNSGNQELLTLHQAMVREAIQARLAYLELLAKEENGLE